MSFLSNLINGISLGSVYAITFLSMGPSVISTEFFRIYLFSLSCGQSPLTLLSSACLLCEGRHPYGRPCRELPARFEDAGERILQI